MRIGKLWMLSLVGLSGWTGISGCAAVKEELGGSAQSGHNTSGSAASSNTSMAEYRPSGPGSERQESTGQASGMGMGGAMKVSAYPSKGQLQDPADEPQSGNLSETARRAEAVATSYGKLEAQQSAQVVRVEAPQVIRAAPTSELMSGMATRTSEPARASTGMGASASDHGSDAHASSPSAQSGHGSSAKPHWSYEGEAGPDNWGSMLPEWKICKSGRNQSPIDIPSGLMVRAGSLDFSYQPIPLEVLNNGHTIQVNNSSSSYIMVEGVRYNLAQFHFHSPSEHTVGGHSFPLELHMVHKNEAGELAVVGLLFDNGPQNPIIDTIWKNVPSTVNDINKVPSLALDIQSMVSLDRGYVYYGGSLTTPPCSEGVKWFVLNQTGFVGAEQVQQFLSVVHENSRPVQFLLGRKVYRNQ